MKIKTAFLLWLGCLLIGCSIFGFNAKGAGLTCGLIFILGVVVNAMFGKQSPPD